MSRSGHKGRQKAVRLVIWIPEAVLEALVWQATTEGVSADAWTGRLLAEAVGDFWEKHGAFSAVGDRALHATAVWNAQKGLVSLAWEPLGWPSQAHHGLSQSVAGNS